MARHHLGPIYMSAIALRHCRSQNNPIHPMAPFHKGPIEGGLGGRPGPLKISAAGPTHVGLAGLVETFGLAVFTWMALTGTLMFFFLMPGQEAVGIGHFIEEIHEIGESLIPVFLFLHVGAVIIHALFGRQLWKPMIFLKE